MNTSTEMVNSFMSSTLNMLGQLGDNLLRPAITLLLFFFVIGIILQGFKMFRKSF